MDKERTEKEEHDQPSTDDERAASEATSPVEEQSGQGSLEQREETAERDMPREIETAQEATELEPRYPQKERRKPVRSTINAMTTTHDGDQPLTAQALSDKEAKEWMTSMNKAANR